MSGIGTQCMICKHAHVSDESIPTTCDAFPNGIPQQLLSGKVFHLTPYKGDNGIMLETDDHAALEDLKEAFAIPENDEFEPLP